VSIPAISDVTDLQQVTAYHAAIVKKLEEIEQLPEALRASKITELKNEVSTTIDSFVTELETYSISRNIDNISKASNAQSLEQITQLADNYKILVDSNI
jgi:hypothetical protein